MPTTYPKQFFSIHTIFSEYRDILSFCPSLYLIIAYARTWKCACTHLNIDFYSASAFRLYPLRTTYNSYAIVLAALSSSAIFVAGFHFWRSGPIKQPQNVNAGDIRNKHVRFQFTDIDATFFNQPHSHAVFPNSIAVVVYSYSSLFPHVIQKLFTVIGSLVISNTY